MLPRETALNPSKRLGTEDSNPLMAELIVSSSNAVLCTKLYLRRMEEWRREYHSKLFRVTT